MPHLTKSMEENKTGSRLSPAEYVAAYQKLSLSERMELDRFAKRQRDKRFLLRQILPFTLIAGWLTYKLFTDPETNTLEAVLFIPLLVLIWVFVREIGDSL